MTDKLVLKSSHEVIYTVDVADVESIFYCKPTDPDILTVLMKDGKRLYCDEVCPIDSLQENPVCAFSTNRYTDEDRKVLCDGCEEKCEYSKKEEPVSIWHDASEEPNGDNSIVIAYDNGCTVEPSFKDFKSYSEWGTIKKSYRVKQWAYVNDVLNLTNKEEPVSEEFGVMADKYHKEVLIGECQMNDDMAGHCRLSYYLGLKDGAKWQKEQIDEILLSEVLPCFMHDGEADEVVAKLDEVLNFQKK